jgi:hypothetical protein
MRTEREYFLGGADLEMVTIGHLLRDHGETVHDGQLSWGAQASAYRDEIMRCLEAGSQAVLVELFDDLGLGHAIKKGDLLLVDHHGDDASESIPTALEQVFQLLDLPAEQWSREYALVAANDRDHVAGMKAIGATADELRRIRALDREAQGITPEEEAQGRQAAYAATNCSSGRLTVVRLHHTRYATVTDALHRDLGGPGFENLLILSPQQTGFYGNGWLIQNLKSRYPGGWWGGALPRDGFWGLPRAVDEREAIELLEDNMSTKSSKQIEVKAFRHIVMWPVLLRGRPISRVGDESALQPWVEEFTRDRSEWQEQLDDPPDVGADGTGIPGVHPRFRYEQIVYFHPFVRDFLFGDGAELLRNRSTRILTRNDILGVDVELGPYQPEGVKLRLDVMRTELYLCKPCVAILVMEVTKPRFVDSDQPVTLDMLQDFTDQFRRLYPPFWWDSLENKMDACKPGLCLRGLTWLGENMKPLAFVQDMPTADVCDPDNSTAKPMRDLTSPKKNFEAFSRTGGEPPLFAHWQWLFGKTVRPALTQKDIRSPHGETMSGLHLQQLLDERMPVMSYFAVDDPAEVTVGDLDRLTFVDASGSDAYPYQAQFLANRRTRYSYERFAHYGTRYFCSGYGFSMIGRANDSMYSQTLLDHFSHHYFCMGLIAHYQRAALLYFADELAISMKVLAGKPIRKELCSGDFRNHVEMIQHRFLKFRSRAFFPEVTNQLQGQELFRLWFDVLETEPLYQFVDSSSERLTSVLAERESRQLSRVATAAIPWGIVLATASVLLAAKGSLNLFKNWGHEIDGILIAILLVSGLVGLLARFLLRADSLWQEIIECREDVSNRLKKLRRK